MSLAALAGRTGIDWDFGVGWPRARHRTSSFPWRHSVLDAVLARMTKAIADR